MLKFMMYILLGGILFMPYIIGLIISVIIICLIRKKLMNTDKKIKILIYAIVLIFCVVISRNLGYSFMLYISAKPDKVYVKMNEINDNQNLIGLSKEEVIELLGKPKYERNSENRITYIYDAGKITNYFFLGEMEFYELIIVLDENNKVISTSIKKDV